MSLNLSYFLFFAVLGSFLPYFTLYLKEIGFSGRDIGILFAIVPFVKSFGPILWGAVADATGKRKRIFVSAALFGAVLATGFLQFKTFPLLALIMAGYSLSRSAIIPMIEATAWEYIDARGGEYGKIRVWGSVGFILSAFLCGNLAQHFGIRFSLYLILFLSWLLVIASLMAPAQKRAAQAFRAGELVIFLKQPVILTFLLTCVLMRLSHGAFTGFYSIHLEELGFNYRMIALMWPIAVGAEMFLMMNYHRVFMRWSPMQVMTLCTSAAALRWVLVALVTHPFAIAATQLLHALTFAGFHIAATSYVNSVFPPQNRTSGQGIFSSLSFGVGGALGIILSGFIYDQKGSGVLFLSFGIIAVLAAVVARVHLEIRNRMVKT